MPHRLFPSAIEPLANTATETEGAREVDTPTAAPPAVQHYVLDDKNDTTYELDGVLLGEATSYREGKLRWFEVKIYKDTAGFYVVHTRGATSVEGEYTKLRVARTSSAFEVIELLRVENRQERFIPRDSMRALAQAAQWDDDLMERWIDLRG